MDRGINLELPRSTVCRPARRGNCIVFLLEKGHFFLWKDGQELEGKSPYAFEPLSPVLLSAGFVCWAKGRIVWFSYDGELIGDLPIKNQGVSLMRGVNGALVFGTSLNTLYYWDKPGSTPISTELLGIPLQLDTTNHCLFTSSAVFYDVRNLKKPDLVDRIKREILGGYRLEDYFIYFDDRGQVFAKHVSGSEKFIDYYNRDFFYPQRSNQKVIYTNRNRQCSVLQIIDSEVRSQPIVELSSNPLWLRWFGAYLMINEEKKSGQSLIKVDSDGNVSNTSVDGSFVPLGIDEARGVFHYRVDSTWYEWYFSEQTPQAVGMDCPEQILFYEGYGLKKVGDCWFDLENRQVNELSAVSHDNNYAYQLVGLIPYNAF